MSFLFLIFFFTPQLQAGSPDLVNAHKYFSFVPAKYQDSLNEYLELTGLSGGLRADRIEEANDGIMSFQSKVHNRCFSALNQELLKRESRIPYSDSSPNLNNMAHNTRNTDVPSGWYWDLANEVAGGDQNLAMMLIGICGNDDAFCPSRGKRSGDPRYREGALGEKTILHPATRQTIVSIQAPNKGGEVLPSKYYHVMGAAYMACSLVRHGVLGPLVSKIQSTLAATYRMHRFCQPPELQPNTFYLNVKDTKTLLSGGYTVDDLVRLTESRPSYDNKLSTELINLYSVLTKQYKTQSPQQRKEKILMMISFSDAHKLLMTQVMSGKNCSAPQVFGQNIRRMKRLAQNRRYKCDGLSQERCDAAKNRLLTWWADAKWTIEQHKLGAQFARNKCVKDPNFIQNFEQRSCSALTKLNLSAETLKNEYSLDINDLNSTP